MQESYRKLEGMGLEFVSGSVVKGSAHIACTVTFMATLDFTHFVHMSNTYVPGYLDTTTNAIRPELEGVAYHALYNRFNSAAGNIGNVEELVRVFSSPNYYLDIWGGNGLQRRYHKPQFDMVGDQIRITGGQDFRWEDEREIKPHDVPDIHFTWALDVLKALPEDPFHSPVRIVTFGYSEQEYVEVGGRPIRKGTHYLAGRDLRLGAIDSKQILIAE